MWSISFMRSNKIMSMLHSMICSYNAERQGWTCQASKYKDAHYIYYRQGGSTDEVAQT